MKLPDVERMDIEKEPDWNSPPAPDEEFSPEEHSLLTEGPIWKAIAYMALPLLLNGMAISAATFADAYVAGKLGADELAAVGIGGQVWFGMIIMAIAIATGANALVSRFWGARDLQSAIQAARQSLMAAFIFGLVSALIGIVLCDTLMHLLGATASVCTKATTYLPFNFLAQIPLTVLWVGHSLFRAKGETKMPTIIMAGVTVSVVLLDFALCLFPGRVGIVGIGYSWLISCTLGAILMLIALRKSELGAALAFDRDHRLNFDLAWFWRIMRIGFPVCLQDLAWVSGNFLLFAIFALCPDPTSLEGAWAIGLRVEDVLAGMPIYAISMGAATIIGQCLGAGKPQRAEKVGWHATLYGASLMLLVGGFMFAFSRPLAFSMSDSASSATAAASYLSIVGLSQPFQLTWVALFGCMEGAGYTRVPMLASFVFLVLVRVPLAYFLTIEAKMGAEGTWLAIALTSALGAIIGILLFRRGTWKLNRV